MVMMSPRAMTTEGVPEPRVMRKFGIDRPRIRVRCSRYPITQEMISPTVAVTDA